MKHLFIGLYLLFFPVYLSADVTPVHDVFVLHAQHHEGQKIRLTWIIPQGYYLIQDKFRLQSHTPGIDLVPITMPDGTHITHPHLGTFKVYRDELSLELPLKRHSDTATTFEMSVSYQGCSEEGECYPIHSTPLHFDLSAHDTPAAEAPPLTSEHNQFLAQELAFLFSAELVNKEHIVLRWHIADGYYLYRQQFSFALQNAPDSLGEVHFPPGEHRNDEFFGEVEVYYHALELTLPLKNLDGLDELVLNVAYRGCAEGSLCYPVTQQNKTFALNSKPPLEANRFSSSGAFNRSANSFGDDDFLPAEEAFRLAVSIEDSNTLIAYWHIADGYYMYRDNFEFALINGGVLGEIDLPAGTPKNDPEFGQVDVYYHQIALRVPLLNTEGRDVLTLQVKFQGCAEVGLCYPPQSEVFEIALPRGEVRALAEDEFNLPTTAAPLLQSEQDRISGMLTQGNLLWVLLSFFGFGLLLSLTPCVFPMIPILSGIIMGQGAGLTMRKGFFISLVYVLAMAVTYAIAGLIAGLLGANLQIIFQTPWVIYTFAFMFVLLALSMFGFYDLQMPASIQTRLNRLSSNQSRGTFIGAAIMGILSALIVGPCVAPPLAAALVYIADQGNPLLGGLVLFVMGVGMGMPLLLIGISAGKFMPRAGGWMDAVKYIFGVLMLAVAVWMLERVLPSQVIMLLWGALLIIPAIYIGALDNLSQGASGWRKLWKGVGIIMLVYGILLIIGGARGSNDVLQPLSGMFSHSDNSTTAATSGKKHALDFIPINTLAELNQAVSDAQAQNRAVMLDFYADWCISCKEMERFTFTDTRVKQAVADMVLLQVDVTAYNQDHKELLKHFKLFGPPGIIFYDRQGQEQNAYRVIGFVDAAGFVTHLETFLAAIKPK
jgi:thioredoxin:protein disulfide reductase